MKTFTKTIEWLNRLAVVSCPTISCKQAAEVAEMLEDAQVSIDTLRKLVAAHRPIPPVEAAPPFDASDYERPTNRRPVGK